MICANPDLVVHRGPKLCYCAGALAKEYEEAGRHGDLLRQAASADFCRGGGQTGGGETGAGGGRWTLHGYRRRRNKAGLDVLFIADGVHGEEAKPFTADHLLSAVRQGGRDSDGGGTKADMVTT